MYNIQEILSELLSHFSRAVGLYSGHSLTSQHRNIVVEVFVSELCLCHWMIGVHCFDIFILIFSSCIPVLIKYLELTLLWRILAKT